MQTRTFIGDLKRKLKDDNIGDIAAMLTYYIVLAIFPMIMFVLTVGLLVVPEHAIQQGLDMATRTMPDQVAALLSQYVRALRSAAGGGLAVVGALLALWAASRGTLALGRGLNVIYGARETRPWWKLQGTAVVTTLVVAVLLLIAMALLAAGPAVGRFLAAHFGLGDAFAIVWTLGRWVLAAALMALVWGILYRALPNTDMPRRPFSKGAMVGVAIWVVASLLFALYVHNFGKYEKTYGALGAVIVFLIWTWLSNVALLTGAAIDALLAHRGVHEPAVVRGPFPEARPV
jgi:membrane protein